MKTRYTVQTFHKGTPRERKLRVKVGYCPDCRDWIAVVGDRLATHGPCPGPNGYANTSASFCFGGES